MLFRSTGGWFPFWVAPEQVRILTINDDILPYATQVRNVLSQVVLDVPVRFNPLRVTIDERKESLGKKIREATSFKIPMQIIVGQKDQDAQEVSVRTRDQETKVKLDQLVEFIKQYNLDEIAKNKASLK